jgi:hypothetical protein
MTDDLIARLRYTGIDDEAEAADALEAQARRIAELEAERDKANQATKDWLSATADEKLENKRLIKRLSGLIQEGLMLVGKVKQRDARIAELEAALKPFSDYWNTSKVVQISEWKNAYLTLNPQSENEPLGPSYGHDGEEK